MMLLMYGQPDGHSISLEKSDCVENVLLGVGRLCQLLDERCDCCAVPHVPQVLVLLMMRMVMMGMVLLLLMMMITSISSR